VQRGVAGLWDQLSAEAEEFLQVEVREVEEVVVVLQIEVV